MKTLTEVDAVLIAACLQSFTAIAVVYVGWRVRKMESWVKSAEHLQTKILDWRLAVYQDVAPLLNDIFCFVSYRGDWKSLTPAQIISHKRMADKKVSIYSPYVSPEFRAEYARFIDCCFRTFAGKGADAQVRCSAESHKEFGNYEWRSEYNSLFVADEIDKADKVAVKNAYERVLRTFAKDVGLLGGSVSSTAFAQPLEDAGKLLSR